MALLKAIAEADSPIGIGIPDAYHRILAFNGDHNNAVEFIVGTYASQAARTASKEPLYTRRFGFGSFDHTMAKNIKTMIYEHLKTLDEYTGATDG